MPPAPEICQARCPVRPQEVLRNAESHSAAQSDRHIRIAGEIKKDLERERQQADPGAERPGLREIAVHRTPQASHRIRQQHFFRKPGAEPPQAFPGLAEFRFRMRDQLLLQVRIAHDGSGHQLREQGQVNAEGHKVLLDFCISPVYIDHIGHRLESEKRDSGRQHRRVKTGLHPRDPVPGIHEETGILEPDQRQQVQHDQEDQHCPGWFSFPGHPLHSAPVQHHAPGDQQQPGRIPPSIKKQGCRQEERHPQPGRQHPVSEQHARHEQEQESKR